MNPAKNTLTVGELSLMIHKLWPRLKFLLTAENTNIKDNGEYDKSSPYIRHSELETSVSYTLADTYPWRISVSSFGNASKLK